MAGNGPTFTLTRPLAAPAIGLGLLALAGLAAGRVAGAAASAPVRLTPIDLPQLGVPAAGSRVALPEPAPAAASGLHRFSGLVGADLSESLARAGVPDGAARDYVAQMLRVEGLAAAISVADRFDLVVADLPGEDDVLVYAGMDRVGRGDVMLLKYGDGKGHVEWVDAGVPERSESGALALPVGGRITSSFGMRMHPLLGFARFHRGLDLAAAMGAPIRAAADGRVASAGWHGGYGRQVALVHGDGITTSYGHMSRITAYAGETVRRGEIIGFVGSSGLSTGPHVHFEVTRNGHAIDPRSARIALPVSMGSAERAVFDGELRSVLTLPARRSAGT